MSPTAHVFSILKNIPKYLAKGLRKPFEVTFLMRPKGYLITYILIILTYAMAYENLPGKQFYAPYAKIEHPALLDIDQVSKNISEAFNESHKRNSNIPGGLRISDGNTFVHNIHTDDNDVLYFDIVIYIMKYDKNGRESGGGQNEYRGYFDSLTYERGSTICHDVTLKLNYAQFNIDDPVILFSRNDPNDVSPNICWTKDREDQLASLTSGLAGNPVELRDSFARMIYFSAITITTTGYGDIVPLTWQSRLLVASEAVLGWIVAGLFLNAIAMQAARTIANRNEH